MSFGQDFLKGFTGNNGLRDATHASKTFRANGYELAPRLKFLFHTYFNLNTTAIPSLNNLVRNGDDSSIGLSVKTVDLPSYAVSVDTLNQYNRKRLVQNKIEYQPVVITFNDDGGDLIRNLWYSYFSYYFKDPVQKYDSVPNINGNSGNQATTPAGFGYNTRDTYSNDRYVNDWGYTGESYTDGTFSAEGKPAFFKDITIYGLNQHKFAAYVLINPMITDWRHDTYDYSQGSSTMTHTVTMRYETVKYFSGAIGASRPDTNVKGFGDPARYDSLPSALAFPGSQATVLGQGGLLDAGVGIIQDLQAGNLQGIIGAVQKALNVNQTLQGTSISDIVRNDATTVKQDILRNSLPGAVRNAVNFANGQIFPKAPPRP
tara:strand:+ start:710 stop:1831 length:1122 start_codon:yes stop_codon:yes gene_type:complete